MNTETATELEISIAKEIINIGFAKSADSLSFFLREKVLIRSMDFNIRPVSEVELFTTKNCENCVILMTEMIGDIKGICYLIFSNEEVERLLKVSLPEEVLNDPEKLDKMSEAILLEVDNIITAAVVTQFSNLLKYKIYGSVPQLQKVGHHEIGDLIRKKSDEEALLINFKAEFFSNQLNFKPEFIWMLDEVFIDGVKNFAKNEKNLKKIKEARSGIDNNQ